MPNLDSRLNLPGTMVSQSWSYSNGRLTSFTKSTNAATAALVVKSRQSSTTVGFHQKRRNGAWLYPLPYTFSKTEYRYCEGYIDWYAYHLVNRTVTSRTLETGHLGGQETSWWQQLHTMPSSMDLAALRRAEMRILSKIKDQKANLAVAYAEADQIADLIAGTAIRLANCMRGLRRGDFRAAANAVGVYASKRRVRSYRKQYDKDQQKAIASGWLQLQYGWLPLLGDVHGAAELLAQKVNRVASTRVEANVTVGDTSHTQSGVLQATRKHEITYRYVVHYAVASEALHTMSQLGLTNPFLIAWELVPFSFVVDWFLPVGDWIGSWDATVGCTFVSGSRTKVSHQETQFTARGWVGEPSAANRHYKDYKASTVAVTVKREVLQGFPSIHIPSPQNPFSFTRAANAIALLTQLFKK